MDEKSFRKIVKEVVEEVVGAALEPVKKDLSELKDLKETVDNRVLPSVIETELTLKSYADSYQINKHNIERLDTRLTTVEDNLGFEPSEDLKVPHFSSK